MLNSQTLPQRPARPPRPAQPLTRSYTEPTFRVAPGEPSKLVDALDLTGQKRSKSSLTLRALPPPQVVAPRAPGPDDSLEGRLIDVRSIIDNAQARQRALAAREQPNLLRDPRMLHMGLVQVLFDDKTGTRYLISPPVRGGLHGEFHLVRREQPDLPSDLWAAKQVRTGGSAEQLQSKASIQPRDRHDISLELYAMLMSGSPLSPTMVLRRGDRLFSLGALCDGDLEDIRSLILDMAPRQAEVFLIDILKQLTPQLVITHRGGLTHRDIKPGNIFYKKNGEIYLADFSLVAKSAEKTGSFGGTFGFVAPEHMNTRPHSLHPKIDVFSLGCTIVDLMTDAGTPFEPMPAQPTTQDSHDMFLESIGLKAFTAKPTGPRSPYSTEHAAMKLLHEYEAWDEEYQAWLDNPAGPFRTRYPKLDSLFSTVQKNFPTLFPIVMGMLAPDPEDRYSSKDLETVLQGVELSAEDRELLAETWANIPRAPELDLIFRRWCEPHLPTLRRTTSADNLPRLHKTVSADNLLLSRSRELGTQST